MSLPQVNAMLTRVTGGGSSEDWGSVAGAGDALWAGSERAYFRASRHRNFGPTDDVLVKRVLTVETGLRQWAEGETVEYTFMGVPATGKIQAVEEYSLPGHPLQTTRLTFEAS